jgi:hypothetical protein
MDKYRDMYLESEQHKERVNYNLGFQARAFFRYDFLSSQ